MSDKAEESVLRVEVNMWKEDARRYCCNAEFWEKNYKKAQARIEDLEQTLGIVYFSGDIKNHFPETHKMVEDVLKESPQPASDKGGE